ncbi:MAG: hypothetical protein MJE63_13740, partial [Proteobacteria bacterium]|nr:hypothetical protein [Pseudomonadota bacterium]
RGITEESILKEAKILTVADVVEAMSSHRPYREALGYQYALDEIISNQGIHYDSDAVEVCKELFQEGFTF